jgi:hypothetical protein
MPRSAEAKTVRSKLDPLVASVWGDHYRAADRRRRRAGWHRRSESQRPKRKLGGGGLLAIVMGLSTVAVVLAVVLPK